MVKPPTYGPRLPADDLDALGELLAREHLPWIEHWGPNGMAVFPRTAKDADDWEERALAMHSRQVMIEIPDKPSEPMRTRLVSELDGPAPPQNFEDSAESARLRGFVRGD